MDIQDQEFSYLSSVEPNTLKFPETETMIPNSGDSSKRTDKFYDKDFLELHGDNGFVVVSKEDVDLIYEYFHSL